MTQSRTRGIGIADAKYSFNGEEVDRRVAELDPKDWMPNGIDMQAFPKNQTREIRTPEIIASAKLLRASSHGGFGHEKVGVMGYCWGGEFLLVSPEMAGGIVSNERYAGFAGFVLGAEGNHGLVDCIVAGHPTLTKADIDVVNVPTMIQAPEFDPLFGPEMKRYAFEKLVLNDQKKIPTRYEHFPGVERPCLTRGSEKIPGERDAMVRGKAATVDWFKLYLK